MQALVQQEKDVVMLRDWRRKEIGRWNCQRKHLHLPEQKPDGREQPATATSRMRTRPCKNVCLRSVAFPLQPASSATSTSTSSLPHQNAVTAAPSSPVYAWSTYTYAD